MVVPVDKQNVQPRCLRYSAISCRYDPSVCFVNGDDTGIGSGISVYNSGRVVCTAVVDNDDFDLFQGLTYNRVEAFTDIPFYIINGYDDRYEGLHV